MILSSTVNFDCNANMLEVFSDYKQPLTVPAVLKTQVQLHPAVFGQQHVQTSGYFDGSVCVNPHRGDKTN